jgi:hypothetical protein
MPWWRISVTSSMRNWAIRFFSRSGRPGVAPQAWHVGGETEDLLASVVVQFLRVGRRLLRVARVSLGEGAQFVVPVGFEGIGHQAMLGIDPPIPSLREVRLVAGVLELLAAQAVHLLGPGAELVLDRQGQLEAERRHRLDE